jgi:hypothetical protein
MEDSTTSPSLRGGEIPSVECIIARVRCMNIRLRHCQVFRSWIVPSIYHMRDVSRFTVNTINRYAVLQLFHKRTIVLLRARFPFDDRREVTRPDPYRCEGKV